MIQSVATALEQKPERSRFLVRELFKELDVPTTFNAYTNSSSGGLLNNWYATALENDLQRASNLKMLIGGNYAPFIPQGIDLAIAGTNVPFLIEIKASESTQPGTAPVVDIQDAIRTSVGKTLTKLLAIAEDESFQDGMDSNLSVGIGRLIERYPAQSVAALTDRLAAGAVSIFSTVEILQTLGRLVHAPSKELRFTLLTLQLAHKSPLVRDATATALTYMNDPRAVAHLKKAIESETLSSLREDLLAAVDQLAN